MGLKRAGLRHLRHVIVFCHGGRMSREPALRPDHPVGETLLAVARASWRSAHRHKGSRRARLPRDPRCPQADETLARLAAAARAVSRRGRCPSAPTSARYCPCPRGRARPQTALDALKDLAHQGLALSPRSLATLHDRIAHIRQTAETTGLTGDMRLSIAAAIDDAEAAAETWPLQGVTFAEIARRHARGYRSARSARPAVW